MYSAIALDLDGTLLNSKKEVSDRNLKAVLKCREIGMKVIIATARPPRSVKRFVPEALTRDCAFVYYNGALVVDAQNELEEHVPIEKQESANILEYCAATSPTCKISVEVKDIWYANQEIEDASLYNLQYQPLIMELEKLKRLEATKLLISNYEEREQLCSTFGEKVHIVVTDRGKLIQIMNKSASKVRGISKLCQHYGIPLSEVMVFGDDHNDIDMFRSCGYSVAMKNGIDQLKQIANEITSTNDQDGVAVVLERVVRKRNLR